MPAVLSYRSYAKKSRIITPHFADGWNDTFEETSKTYKSHLWDRLRIIQKTSKLWKEPEWLWRTLRCLKLSPAWIDSLQDLAWSNALPCAGYGSRCGMQRFGLVYQTDLLESARPWILPRSWHLLPHQESCALDQDFLHSSENSSKSSIFLIEWT